MEIYVENGERGTLTGIFFFRWIGLFSGTQENRRLEKNKRIAKHVFPEECKGAL